MKINKNRRNKRKRFSARFQITPTICIVHLKLDPDIRFPTDLHLAFFA